MNVLEVIADDLTGACDVAAELAAAGFGVRVTVDGAAAPGDASAAGVRVVNTQSRAVRAREAQERVLRTLRGRAIDILLKKIDTALRGHLGAELDAAIDGLGATAAFVVPAIPAVGRVTRGGCQWFGGRPLSETEFAADPEGGGAEASVAAVIARESRRRIEVIGLDTLRGGHLTERARTLMRAGTEVFVVDAETDEDLAVAARGILDLPRPLCIAGSIGVTAGLARAIDEVRVPGAVPDALVTPALIVCGSLHSTARSQVTAVCAADLASAVTVPMREGVPAGSSAAFATEERAAVAQRIRALLHARRSVVLSADPPVGPPDEGSRRALERALADVACRALQGGTAAALVLIGGETSYAVLRALGASELIVRGRVTPLVASGEIVSGRGAGLRLIVKGGSGGDTETLQRVFEAALPRRRAAV
jgi:uncharacterized protein YgbK (DUF1537 family)